MGAKRPKSLVDIYFACLGVWVFVSLSVCLYPLKVKTTEPIGAREGLWIIKISKIIL